MKWQKIKPNKLSENEVLATKFTRGFGCCEKIIGYLSYDEDTLYCGNDYETLDHPTHFIEIHNFDLPLKDIS